MALVAGLSAPATAASAAPAALSPTVEEQRLDQAVPQEILARSGFDDVAPEFARELTGARAPSSGKDRRWGGGPWTGRRGGGRRNQEGAKRFPGRVAAGHRRTSAGTTTGPCTGRGSA